jgi:HD-GYP domain-containing protein (c-di-GMP phosphodiesterase class II)
MRLVPIDDVEPGARLGRDIWGGASGEIPLLRVGARLGPDYLERLRAGGIVGVYIDDELSAGIDIPTALREQTRRKAGKALQVAFVELPGMRATGGPVPQALAADLTQAVRAILDDLEASGDAILAFADLATVDAYTMQHSINVAVLGLVVGRRLFRDDGWVDHRGVRRYDGLGERLVQLGLGLLLHDIGKLTIPVDVLHKAGPLDQVEWELIHTHPTAGVAMLKGDLIGARAKSVVRSHHERYDGSGYPDRLKGDGIPQLARIGAVADVYDAITSQRPYRGAAPASVGVAEITAGDNALYDPAVVRAFRAVVAPHPVGTSVTLSDGREGIVSQIPPERADRPVVRVVTDEAGNRLETAVELPLARHPEIEIAPGRRDLG